MKATHLYLALAALGYTAENDVLARDRKLSWKSCYYPPHIKHQSH